MHPTNGVGFARSGHLRADSLDCDRNETTLDFGCLSTEQGFLAFGIQPRTNPREPRRVASSCDERLRHKPILISFPLNQLSALAYQVLHAALPRLLIFFENLCPAFTRGRGIKKFFIIPRCTR